MAYQTGTANDVLDLADKIADFAVAQGWTEDAGAAGDRYLHSGSCYVRLLGNLGSAGGPWLYAYGGTGYSAGLVDQSPFSGCNLAVSPVAEYHLFCTAQYIHCAFLCSSGSWNNLMLGELTKTNNFVGGTYAAGTNFDDNGTTNPQVNLPYSTVHSYPFDCYGYNANYGKAGGWSQVGALRPSDTHKWFAGRQKTPAGDQRQGNGYITNSWSSTTVNASTDNYTTQNALMPRSNNTFNGLNIMHPLMVNIHYQDGYYTTLGNPQDVRLVNIKHLNPKDIITIGSDDWMVFPAKSKVLIDTSTPYSQYIGYAYLRNV